MVLSGVSLVSLLYGVHYRESYTVKHKGVQMIERNRDVDVARRPSPPLLTACAGLLFTLAALAVLYADRLTGNLLAAHIQDGYPDLSPSRIEEAARTYLGYLSAVGVLGLAGWAITIRLVARRRRSTPWVATGLFVVGTTVALFDLLVRDTSGDTGLPPLLGWVGLLPSLAGLAVVVLLLRTSLLHTERH